MLLTVSSKLPLIPMHRVVIDVFTWTDQRQRVCEFIRDRRDGFHLPAREPQILHALRGFGETAAFHDALMEIFFLGTHAADIESQVLFHRDQCLGEIVALADTHGTDDFKTRFHQLHLIGEQVKALRRHQDRQPAIELRRREFHVLGSFGT
jgi:hypothetical protein